MRRGAGRTIKEEAEEYMFKTLLPKIEAAVLELRSMEEEADRINLLLHGKKKPRQPGRGRHNKSISGFALRKALAGFMSYEEPMSLADIVENLRYELGDVSGMRNRVQVRFHRWIEKGLFIRRVGRGLYVLKGGGRDGEVDG